MQYPHSPPLRRVLHILTILLTAASLLTMPGCGLYDKYFKKDDQAEITEESQMAAAQLLVMEGMEEFNQGKYHNALEIFQDIRDRYPFSQPGLLAELKSADCNYHLKRYLEALMLYDEFENGHPTNEAIPYVIFQKGMCHYQRIDTIDRDPAGAQDAIQAFSRLVRAYPQSPYVEEARFRIVAARDFLARHEMYVVDFYINTKSYKQAEARLEYLLDHYPDTSVSPKAEELLTLLKAGTPPKSRWRDWIPEIGLPDWALFKQFGIFGGGEDSE